MNPLILYVINLPLSIVHRLFTISFNTTDFGDEYDVIQEIVALSKFSLQDINKLFYKF